MRGPAMKPGIHPEYHLIKVTMTDGTEYTTRSTWGKEGDVLHLDIDPKTHPAWTGGQQQFLDRGAGLSRFQRKFAGFIKSGRGSQAGDAFGPRVSPAGVLLSTAAAAPLR